MNYILNTKTKKLELFWDTQEEYRALINFISNFSITEEQSPYTVKTPEFRNPSITWATNNLPNNITFTGDALEGVPGITTILDSTAETAKVSLNNGECSTYVNNSINASETKI